MAKLLKNAAAGAAAGSVWAGVPGAVVGGLFGLGNSIAENRAQKNADKRSRKFQEEQAQKQFDRQRYFDSLEKRWNSEQAQLQRMKDAGLNPNLVYGQLSDSTASTPSVPLGSVPNGVSRDFDVASSALQGSQIGVDSILKAAQVDNLNQNTANQFQDTQGKEIENRFKEAGIIQTLTEQLERINKIRADILKTGADTKTVDALRDSLVEQLASEISLNKQRVDESKQNVEKSKQDVLESKSRVDVNKQNITESKQRVDESKQRIDESKQNINESKSRERLNNSNRIFKDVETKDLVRKYSLNVDQYRMIHDFVKKHDLPEGSEKSIIDALNSFAEATGKTIPEVTGNILEDWLSASTWLNYLAQEHRTDAIKDGNNESVDGTFTPPPPNQSNSNSDSGLQRNSDKYEEEFDRTYTPNQKRFIVVARKQWPYLNQDKKQEYYKWLDKTPYSTQYERAAKVQKLYYEQTGSHKLPDDD